MANGNCVQQQRVKESFLNAVGKAERYTEQVELWTSEGKTAWWFVLSHTQRLTWLVTQDPNLCTFYLF